MDSKRKFLTYYLYELYCQDVFYREPNDAFSRNPLFQYSNWGEAPKFDIYYFATDVSTKALKVAEQVIYSLPEYSHLTQFRSMPILHQQE